jgi:hypothetical protein
MHQSSGDRPSFLLAETIHLGNAVPALARSETFYLGIASSTFQLGHGHAVLFQDRFNNLGRDRRVDPSTPTTASTVPVPFSQASMMMGSRSSSNRTGLERLPQPISGAASHLKATANRLTRPVFVAIAVSWAKANDPPSKLKTPAVTNVRFIE